MVPLINNDIEMFRSFPKGLPGIYFFRHAKGNGSAKPGSIFGKDYLYKWWKKACANLGINDVDLYGGTRYSSTITLRKFKTPEEIKRATMHSTNKVFERYFYLEGDEPRNIYEDTQDKRVKKRVGGKKSTSPGTDKLTKNLRGMQNQPPVFIE
jgi:hypothetical protein